MIRYMSNAQHHLRIECGAHGARPRLLATAVDYRHVTASAAQERQQRRACSRELLGLAATGLPPVPHEAVALERLARFDRNAHREDRGAEWRSQGAGTRRLDGDQWLIVCPDARCRPATVPTALVASALDSGVTSLDISDLQRT